MTDAAISCPVAVSSTPGTDTGGTLNLHGSVIARFGDGDQHGDSAHLRDLYTKKTWLITTPPFKKRSECRWGRS